MRFAVGLAVLSACFFAGEPATPPVTQVPTLAEASVEVDGRIDAAEWKGAHELEVAPEVTLLSFHTQDEVFLAVRITTASPSYVDLFLLLEDEKRMNLHASMQIGEREVGASGWDDRNPPTRWGRQDGWRASSVREAPGKPASAPLRELFVPYDGFEFKLSKHRFGRKGWRMRLEVRDFEGRRPDLVFPAGSDRFDAQNWAEFSLSA